MQMLDDVAVTARSRSGSDNEYPLSSKRRPSVQEQPDTQKSQKILEPSHQPRRSRDRQGMVLRSFYHISLRSSRLSTIDRINVRFVPFAGLALLGPMTGIGGYRMQVERRKLARSRRSNEGRMQLPQLPAYPTSTIFPTWRLVKNASCAATISASG